MVILSGPEPQRGLLETILKPVIEDVVFIRNCRKGTKKEQLKNITYFNFMTSRQLEQTLMKVKLFLARSATQRLWIWKLGKPFHPYSWAI
jgi:hypothetical protein